MNSRTSFTSQLTALFLACGVVTAPSVAKAAAGPSIYEISQSYFSAALDTAGEYWTSAVAATDDWLPDFSLSSAGMLTRHLEVEGENSEFEFTNMMSAAGYSVKSVKMGVGVLPKVSFSFGQKREMSSVDFEYVQRQLRRHKLARSGPEAMAERLIVQSIIDIQHFPKYNVAKVDVTLLPLPSVDFTAEPKSLTLSSETSYVVRRIDKLNSLLEQISDQ